MEERISLTDKWRPKCFGEVVGQNTVVSILAKQITNKAWKNVYLFCGSSGAGKTSVARIMANEINDGHGSPIEIDGASNNGVENIRNLIADAQQSSIDCKYKVYIIDECHQLSRQAWDASLKLIEEPPKNSIFIFCTTNPDKVPDTILSRVQRFDFYKVDKGTIADRLEYILNEEEYVDYDRSALEIIASKANGNVRDAIQLLDKCVGSGEKISSDLVERSLGMPKYEIVLKMVEKIVSDDIKSAIECLNKLRLASSDMVQVYDMFMQCVLDYALYSQFGDISFTSIPSDYKNSITKNVEVTKKLSSRVVEYSKIAKQTHADALLEALIVEFCGR